MALIEAWQCTKCRRTGPVWLEYTDVHTQNGNVISYPTLSREVRDAARTGRAFCSICVRSLSNTTIPNEAEVVGTYRTNAVPNLAVQKNSFVKKCWIKGITFYVKNVLVKFLTRHKNGKKSTS